METWWSGDGDKDVEKHARRFLQREASVASTSTILPDTADGDDYCEIIEADAEPDVLFSAEVIDLTKDDSETLIQQHRPNETQLNSVSTSNGTVVKPGNLIQTRKTFLGQLKIDFVQVTSVVLDGQGETLIRGIPYTRLCHLNGKIADRINEVCMVLHTHKHANQEPDPPILVDVKPECIVRWRKFILTNATYPVHSVDADRFARRCTSPEQRQLVTKKFGSIVCRWKISIVYSIDGRTRNKAEQESIEHLRSDDVRESKYRVLDEQNFRAWRGHRKRGGAWNSNFNSKKPLNIPVSRQPGQMYTLFDSFSGAGGVSRGAQDAGIKVRYALDKEPEDYIAEDTAEKPHEPVDILHLSPPCQVWSPAHTHDGPNDATNTEALYTCGGIIKKARPRILTLEQTFGITWAKHLEHFWALIGGMTDLGYSVRWSIVRLCTWGSPQDRKRLIIVASAPGERLPPFPAPTHSEHGLNGTSRFNTVASTIARVHAGQDLHSIHEVKSFHPPKPRWDANILGRTITTGGANAYHPSGLRDFTLRELAYLQGFPKSHRFVGTLTKIRRQIGNSFPPNTVYVLYKHLHEWLLKQDNVGDYVAEDVMVIDDDSDSSEAESVIFDEGRISPAMEDVVMGDADDDLIFVGTSPGRDYECFVDLT
ncbi:hypothetical protein NLG97_g2968 [Lecanicillium saksenae]|uniref:Uncharacterized protein n=1 Tax=Lecanicillium saksenae TaxID=468837 RepID=A0ACC1R0N1_9HYPO|nr:hypothetical protein NLG97_g2968 [Lecanicillium saksenae]